MRFRRALTLFEVLIALVLLFIFLFSFFNFLNGVRNGSEKISEEIKREDFIDAMFNSLERSIQTTYCHDPKFGSGVFGDRLSIFILSYGIMPRNFMRSKDKSFRETFRTSIRYDEQSQSLFFQRALVDNKSANGAASSFKCAGIQFRYFVDSEWKFSFDSSYYGRLPNAIECSLWLEGTEGSVAADRQRVFSLIEGGYD